MDRHRRIVALEFRLAAILLGALSLVTLADSAYTAWVLHNAPPADASPPLDIGKYGLVGLLENGGLVAGSVVHTLLSTASWFVAFVAVIAFVQLLFSGLIYVTGRGIFRRAGWARVVGVLLSLALALIAIPALAVVDRGAIPVVAVPAVLSLYTLWALLWRYG